MLRSSHSTFEDPRVHHLDGSVTFVDEVLHGQDRTGAVAPADKNLDFLEACIDALIEQRLNTGVHRTERTEPLQTGLWFAWAIER